jgi:PBP1b-binding outer membrane lipoprotein LpoB
MKFLIALAFGALMINSCTSADQQAKATGTKDSTTIQWIDSIDQSIGKINQGEVVEVLWHFKNSGDKPLVIEKVTPGCGCTGADWTKEPIAPGKEGTITAKFDSKNFEGTQHKSVTVKGNYKNNTSGGFQDVLAFNVEVVPAAKK